MRYPAFIGGSYESQSPLASPQRTINFVVERMEVAGAKNTFVLYPSPGMAPFVTLPEAPVRAIGWAPGGRGFAVAGSGLYELFADGTQTLRGTVQADSQLATISTNGPNGGQLLITSGNKGYVYTLATNTLAEVLSTGARQGRMLDGYFLVLDPDASQLRISNLFDGLTWNGLFVQQRSLAPDPWVSLAVLNREIWLFGERTTEVWYNTGEYPYPFAPRSGALMGFGIAAPWSVASVGGAAIWLSRNDDGHGVVVMAQGYQPTPISTHALNAVLRQLPSLTDAEAFGFEQDGHLYYVLSVPGAETSWVFDLSAGLWMEFGHWSAAEARFRLWDPRVHALLFNRHLVGSRTTGQVSTLSPAITQEADGSPIRRVRRAPGLAREHRWIFYDALDLYVEPGLGDPQSDPTVLLRWSDDGGKTWSGQHEASVSAGAAGRFRTRVVFRRLGRSRDRVFEVSMSDPIPWRIVDAYLTTRLGTS